MVERRHQLEFGTKHEQAAYWKGLGFNSATANIASINAAQADGGP